MPMLKQTVANKKKFQSLNTSDYKGSYGEALGALPIMSLSEPGDEIMYCPAPPSFITPKPYSTSHHQTVAHVPPPTGITPKPYNTSHHPTVSYVPPPTGITPKSYNTSHHPTVSYVPPTTGITHKPYNTSHHPTVPYAPPTTGITPKSYNTSHHPTVPYVPPSTGITHKPYNTSHHQTYVPQPLFSDSKGPLHRETLLKRKFARRWYLNLWHKKIRNNTEASYRGLRYGKIWSNIDPDFDRQAMGILSKGNIHKLENNIYRYARETGYKTSDIDEFVKEFCKLDFILSHFTKENDHFQSLKSQTLLQGKSQRDIIKGLSGITSGNEVITGNTMAADISSLSNTEFVFFKFQLNPKTYLSLSHHRSRFGSNAYVFPLHDTKLLRFGHIYNLDPLCFSDKANELDLALFHQHIKSNQQKIREVKSGNIFHYPLTQKNRKLDERENIFYGPLILKGIALYILNEAYHMSPNIFMNLISNRNALESKKMIHLLDTMLTKAMKIQALIPREIGTAFSDHESLI